MAGVFTDIELEWDGRVYTIPPRKVMGAIARIEDIITLGELQRYGERETLPISKLCMAFGAVLRYAGAQVKDDEIYEAIFAGQEEQQAITEAVVNLMQMMLPPSVRANLDVDNAAQGQASGNSPAAAKPASSKRPSRRRSQKASG